MESSNDSAECLGKSFLGNNKRTTKSTTRKLSSEISQNLVGSGPRKCHQLAKERSIKPRDDQASDLTETSKTILQQNHFCIQRIADEIEKVLPKIKTDCLEDSGKSAVCFICSKSLNENYFKEHILAKHFHRSLKCPKCNKLFNFRSAFRIHMLIFHKSKQGKPELQKSIFTIKKTKKTKKTNEDQTILKRNLSYIQRIADEISKFLPEIRKNFRLNKKSIVCFICFKPLDTKNYNNHVLGTHFHSGFECKLCYALFSYRPSMIRHMKRVHESGQVELEPVTSLSMITENES